MCRICQAAQVGIACSHVFCQGMKEALRKVLIMDLEGLNEPNNYIQTWAKVTILHIRLHCKHKSLGYNSNNIS